MKKQQSTLSLRVVNSERLESGRSADCLFGQDGGIVGSGTNNHWSVQDQGGNLDSAHFAIEWRDGAFCLRVVGQPLYINRSELSSRAGPVRLQQGDEVVMGLLTLKCHIATDADDIQDPLTRSPESLVSSYHNPLELILEGGSAPYEPGANPESGVSTAVVNDLSLDPLRVLQSESLAPLNDHATANADLSHALQQDRYRAPLFSSPLSDSAKDSAMDQDFIDLPQINQFLAGAQEPQRPNDEELEQQHVAITPLMRGIDAQLPLRNSQEANDFLEEIGRTLKAAIGGLLELQRAQHGLSDKHLRPLEDNPLRLNLDYDAALKVMFGDQKSPVHLSAPAAVAESLQNLRLHHQANEQAIVQALSTMLDAFSPQHLVQRFAQYRRSSERQEMDPAWAWEMYNSYYQELMSSRQQGFEKLFREVYDQAYDRALRQGLQERES